MRRLVVHQPVANQMPPFVQGIAVQPDTGGFGDRLVQRSTATAQQCVLPFDNSLSQLLDEPLTQIFIQRHVPKGTAHEYVHVCASSNSSEKELTPCGIRN
jgi:hypothetical protein